MDAIYIPELTAAPNCTDVIEFKEFLPGLSTLMPVQGQLKIVHQGSYLEVSASAETIMTLTCNRCLNQYNYRLKIKPSEVIWLEETAPATTFAIEQEIELDDLIETLPPSGYFEPGTWLYEQFCLAIPSKQLCDANCPGVVVNVDEGSQPAIDSRWAALKALQGQLPNSNSLN
jgi:uncharacterized protein